MRPLLVLLTAMMLTACGNAPAPAEAFEKLAWRVAGDTSAQPMTLQFDAEEKRVHGFSGCNRFGGSYALDSNQIRFGALMGTKMACAEPTRNRSEHQFLEALSHVDSYLFEGDTLTLYDAQAAQLVRFRAMPTDASAHDAH